MTPNSLKPDVPYWRLSGFYFFYFALLGGLLGYWSVYLKEAGYTITEIGTVMATLQATKIIAPNIWGWLADKTQQRLRIVRFGALFTVICYAFVFLKPEFIGMLLVMTGFSFFWNAILPQQEVVTLNHLGVQRAQYSKIRMWGSIGFILTSTILGLLFDYVSIDWLPFILISIMAGIWFSAQFLTEEPVVHHEQNHESFLKQLWRPGVLVFFLLGGLMAVTHGPYYAFFLIYLQDFGYSKFDVGLLISLGVLAEVVIFMVMHTLMKRFSIKQLATLCFILAAIRWWVIGKFPDNVFLLVLVQLGHAATFGIFHAICIHMVHHYFSSKSAGQGQAFYSSVSHGLGGALGAYLSGVIWVMWGPENTYLAAAGVAIVAALITMWKMESFSAPQDAVSYNCESKT